MQARRERKAVSSLYSYGLVVHLLLLPTTHRCVAVAFGYRPESVYLERTLTSLTIALSGAHATGLSRGVLTFAATLCCYTSLLFLARRVDASALRI